MRSITIKDETASGEILNEIALSFANEYITVRELIGERIRVEVDRYKSNMENHRALVQPSASELRLNRKQPYKIDVEKQIYVALDAFEKNGFFILLDNDQAEELDQKFLVDASTEISFVKLTPLVGG